MQLIKFQLFSTEEANYFAETDLSDWYTVCVSSNVCLPFDDSSAADERQM